MREVLIRFDEDPALFFRLRQASIDELVTDALHRTSDELLNRAEHQSTRALTGSDLAGLFGIALNDSGSGNKEPVEAVPAQVSAPVAKKRGRPRKS